MVERETHDSLKRAYEREKKARQEAERIIEEKSTELFHINKELEALNNSLEQKVTERTKQLKDEQQKAEKLASIKQQFLANMSHEVRTPMNAIVGFVNLLIKSEANEKKLRSLRAIEKSSKNLLVIINDILDISKIENGKMKIEKIDLDLKHLVNTLLNTFNELTEKPGLNLLCSIDSRIGWVKSDQVRLNQIFINLISNSIKFTDHGEVSFKAEVLSDLMDSQLIKFTVSDTGIGIDQEKISTIFDSFSQADQSITRKYGGTGLGLTITKELISLLGGQISVTSEKGVGTNFELIIPFQKGDFKQVTPTGADLDLAKIRQLRVLVAEDNDLNQFLIESIFDEWGLDYTIVSSGLAAIKAVKEREFDIILMDVQMPEMSGLDATRVIRTDMKLDVPIIALTANAMQDDKLKYLKDGMNGYVIKPFSVDELYHAILKTVNLTTKGKNGTINLTSINKIYQNDPQFIRTVLSKISTHLGEKVLNNSAFKTALDASALTAIRTSLHEIKASLILLNEVELTQLIDQLSSPEIKFEQVTEKIEVFLHRISSLKERLDAHVQFLL